MAREVQVIGLDRLLKKLDPAHALGELPREIPNEAARTGQLAAIAKAPVLTGELQRSIRLRLLPASAAFLTPLGAKAKALEGGRHLPPGGRRARSRAFHYMRKGKTEARKELTRQINKAVADIERRWEA